MKLNRLYCAILFLALLGGAITWSYQSRAFKNRLGAFTTDLSARTVGQRQNILRLTELLNNQVLKAGETFSFNTWLGPDLEKYGLSVEHVIVEGQVTNEIGGGICQLASTFYNAALLAGLSIENRVAHSKNVASSPSSQDATVKWGTHDLIIRNPFDHPVKIIAKPNGEQLIVAIYGSQILNNHLVRIVDAVGVSKLLRVGQNDAHVVSYDAYNRR